MNYELKDKITTTEELLQELEAKCWQEIDYLQAQINNLADGATNNKLRQLFKNLLTSYYIFTGGIETLAEAPIDNTATSTENTEEEPIDVEQEIAIDNEHQDEDTYTQDIDANNLEVSDPFEYFVDFDDPVGEPLTDEDLYKN